MIRSARLLTAVVAVLGVTPAVSHAGPLDSVAIVDVHDTAIGNYRVASTCAAVLGTATKLNQITWVVRASADSAGPSVPLSTVVRCVVYNTATRRAYSPAVAGGLPGNHAEAVKQVDVPTNATVAVCVEGGANFLDGAAVALDGHCPD